MKALSWSRTKDVLFPEKCMRPLARKGSALGGTRPPEEARGWPQEPELPKSDWDLDSQWSEARDLA